MGTSEAAARPIHESTQENGVASPLVSGTAVILYVALVRVVLYLFAGPQYGYFAMSSTTLRAGSILRGGTSISLR